MSDLHNSHQDYQFDDLTMSLRVRKFYNILISSVRENSLLTTEDYLKTVIDTNIKEDLTQGPLSEQEENSLAIKYVKYNQLMVKLKNNHEFNHEFKFFFKKEKIESMFNKLKEEQIQLNEDNPKLKNMILEINPIYYTDYISYIEKITSTDNSYNSNTEYHLLDALLFLSSPFSTIIWDILRFHTYIYNFVELNNANRREHQKVTIKSSIKSVSDIEVSLDDFIQTVENTLSYLIANRCFNISIPSDLILYFKQNNKSYEINISLRSLFHALMKEIINTFEQKIINKETIDKEHAFLQLIDSSLEEELNFSFKKISEEGVHTRNEIIKKALFELIKKAIQDQNISLDHYDIILENIFIRL